MEQNLFGWTFPDLEDNIPSNWIGYSLTSPCKVGRVLRRLLRPTVVEGVCPWYWYVIELNLNVRKLWTITSLGGPEKASHYSAIVQYDAGTPFMSECILQPGNSPHGQTCALLLLRVKNTA